MVNYILHVHKGMLYGNEYSWNMIIDVIMKKILKIVYRGEKGAYITIHYNTIYLKF